MGLCERRYVSSYEGPRADNAAMADPHIADHAHTSSQEAVATHNDHIVVRGARCDDWLHRVGGDVSAAQELAVVSCQDVVADLNFFT